uniref:Lipase n=2 Tax=Caenorhabditis tropicalis TaxID=1561998 RepID=A0A1I7US38_9PELO
MNINMLVFNLLTVFGVMADIYGPLSDHFMHHLNKRPKRNDGLLRSITSFGETGSFGGKVFSEEKLTNTPIVFIHGNSDSALKFGDHPFQSGWDEVLKYFLAKDYTLAELYGITYGDRNISHSYTRKFTCELLHLHRRFIELVLHYTKAGEINIIAHSMGVSIARKVIQGGEFVTETESCDIGPNLSHRIGTFISLASANYGMCPCQHAFAFPACGMETGFFPGTCSDAACSSQNVNATETCGDTQYSSYLMDLNKNAKKDASFVASMWSDDDEILGKGNMVWGRHTSLVPHSDMRKVYHELTHNDVKTLTAADQYNIIQMNNQKFRAADAHEY